MANIVKMGEYILNNSNHKKFQDCIVIPIINSAGSRSQHLGNIVFWNSVQKREIINSKKFHALGWQDLINFKQELGDRFVTIRHNIYQPYHYKIKNGEKKSELLKNYNGELDEFISSSPECSGTITWMDSFFVEYKDTEEFIPEGLYKVVPKEKNGKTNFHFNPTTEEQNAVWVDLSSYENFYTENLWQIIDNVPENYIIQNTIRSGGGKHHSNVFLGIIKNRTKLRHYTETYKNRQGNHEEFFVVKDNELIEIFEG